MTQLSDTNLALFLDNGTSLERWDQVGILSRELAIYNRMASSFRRIYIFTYGTKQDLSYQHAVEKNIVIIPKAIRLYDYLYEIAIPFRHRRILAQCGILKTNQCSGSLAAIITKWLYHNKCVARFGFVGSSVVKRLHRPLHYRWYIGLSEYLSCRFADRIFMPMKNNVDHLRTRYAFAKDKIVQMNNAIDTDLFSPQPTEKKYDIIYVAHLNDNKNHRAILEAISGLTVSVCFIGRGPQEHSLKEFAAQQHISLDIIAQVPNQDLPKYFNASRLCVFPSLHEGNPKSLLEAMSCALPVIGFDVTGVHDLIISGKTGLLSQNTVSSLRSNIEILLQDKARQAELGKKARAYIMEYFSLTNIAQKELAIYQQLLNHDH
ncbi:MAG: glycosyltransferase family 4 protein [Patescibacteria group bacterium]|jgi:glycosyltransferase involved in cell wall biosynthesis